MKIFNNCFLLFHSLILMGTKQGWEFAQGFSEQIAHGHSFLVSDLSDSLTLLIFGERPERFFHIAHQKKGMSESLIF